MTRLTGFVAFLLELRDAARCGRHAARPEKIVYVDISPHKNLRDQKMAPRSFLKHFHTSLILFLFLSAGSLMAAQQQSQYLDKGLFLKARPGQIGMTGPVMARIVEGKAIDARRGESLTFPDGKDEVWKEEVADSGNWFRGKYLDGAYAYFTVNSPDGQTVILESFGDDFVYVNGVPREGNKYGYKDTYPKWEASYNYSEIPIRLMKGKNELLFLCNRGRLKARLRYIDPGVQFNTKDVTLPNFLIGKGVDDYAAVVLINATEKPITGALLKKFSASPFKIFAET